MKRIFALILALTMALSLAACGGSSEETSAATTEATTAATTEATTVATTEATTAPTEAVVANRNPLTGEELDEPYVGRIFAVTINNVPHALPHSGVSQADMYFEMLVNDGAVRGLALYTDPSDVTAIGSIRSARYNFVDVCQSYNAILVHAGGSTGVMNDVYNSIDNINDGYDCFFRDYDRYYDGYDWEHILFADGSNLEEAAIDCGYETELTDHDYGLHFTDGPAVTGDGEDAAAISLSYWSNNVDFAYDEETGKYNYSIFGDECYDAGNEDAPEAYKNVILLHTEIYQYDVYHLADLEGSGEGYYACEGKIIPILWERESDGANFVYTLTDGTPLELAVGNSYVGFVPTENDIEWE